MIWGSPKGRVYYQIYPKSDTRNRKNSSNKPVKTLERKEGGARSHFEYEFRVLVRCFDSFFRLLDSAIVAFLDVMLWFLVVDMILS